MTYVYDEIPSPLKVNHIKGWKNKNRLLKDINDFKKMNSDYLNENPYLKSIFKSKKFKKILDKKNVLDIGVGWGSSSLFLSKLGAIVTGIDISSTSIKGARRNIKLHSCKNVKLLQMDAEKINFSNDKFDYVYSWGVIHHSASTENILKQIRRVLKPNGKGMIMVYNKNSIRYYFLGFYYLFFKGKIFKSENLESVQKYFTDGYWHRHFTPKELIFILRKYGLQTENIKLTYMKRRCFPGLKSGSNIDNWLKSKFGWLLVAHFKKANI